jgi:hypothetical protein
MFILFIKEVIGVIGLEDAMMHEGVRPEWVGQAEESSVHDEPMERPFKEGPEHDAGE